MIYSCNKCKQILHITKEIGASNIRNSKRKNIEKNVTCSNKACLKFFKILKWCLLDKFSVTLRQAIIKSLKLFEGEIKNWEEAGKYKKVKLILKT